jgi:hypothetical protein
MNDKQSENHKLIKSHFYEVVFPSPAFTVSETVLVEVVMDDVTVALQQDDSYKEQDYAKHHSSAHGFASERLGSTFRYITNNQKLGHQTNFNRTALVLACPSFLGNNNRGNSQQHKQVLELYGSSLATFHKSSRML